MLASVLAGIDIDFSEIIIAVIHEMAFLRTTTMPFPCLICCLCKEDTMPLWNCDRLTEETKIVDVGLIKDSANPTALRKGIQVELAHLGNAITADVVQTDEDPILSTTAEPVE
uniref:Integrase core domain containing protein n=1 Tax=Solanum tuberosum TaxID=4113 RepID=M1DMG7_SOLTU